MRTLLIAVLIAAASGCATFFGPSPPKSEQQVQSLQRLLDQQATDYRLKRLLKEDHEQRAPHKR